jgi:signal transduction histidine kinase
MAAILSFAPFLACAALAAALLQTLRHRRYALQECATQRAAYQDLVRLVRITTADMRSTAVALLGRAQTAEDPDRGFLLSTQASLLDLTDALLRQTEAPDPGHHLQEEAIRLRPVLDFVVAQVTCQLGPGRRAWRLADDLHGIELLADRRALHQVLLRVLTSAALATREGDWIAISAGWSDDVAEGGWTLTVEDEGSGLPIEASRVAGRLEGPAGGQDEARETRGWGAALTLARTLMQSHGGLLTVQSAASVGTRVGLAFPATRVIGGVPAPRPQDLAA